MEYPYIKMIQVHDKQIVMEICCLDHNYRIIIKDDNLFDRKIILKQKYQKSEGKKLLSIYDLHNFNYIDFKTKLRLFKELCN